MKKSITLIELIVVLAIVGIGATLFFSVLFISWRSFDAQITRTDLWQEADQIIETISLDGRFANGIVFSAPRGGGEFDAVTFNFIDGGSVTYTILPGGELRMMRAGQISTLSAHLNYTGSLFREDPDRPDNVGFNLTLEDTTLGGILQVATSVELSRRNF